MRHTAPPRRSRDRGNPEAHHRMGVCRGNTVIKVLDLVEEQYTEQVYRTTQDCGAPLNLPNPIHPSFFSPSATKSPSSTICDSSVAARVLFTSRSLQTSALLPFLLVRRNSKIRVLCSSVAVWYFRIGSRISPLLPAISPLLPAISPLLHQLYHRFTSYIAFTHDQFQGGSFGLKVSDKIEYPSSVVSRLQRCWIAHCLPVPRC